MKRLTAATLALAMVLSILMLPGIIPEAKAAQTDDVNLSNQITVTVPTELAVAVSADGKVTVATDATIHNDSVEAITVNSIHVTPLNDWTLRDYKTTIFTDRDAGKKEFALAFDGQGIGTGGVCVPYFLNPVQPGRDYRIDYGAKIPIQTEPINEAIAKVVFILGLVDKNAEKNRMTITFVDSDNTILGQLEGLYTDTDIREQVEEYVKTNFIPSNLWDVDPSSTEIKDYYSISSKYKLTNKQNFAFVRQPIKATVHPGTWVIQENPSYMGYKQYKYVYGWALCSESNYSDVETVIGEGDLSNYNSVAFVYDGDYDFTVPDLEQGIETSDFEHRHGMTQEVYLKAIYQPGTPVIKKYVPDIPENRIDITLMDWDNALIGALPLDVNSDNLERFNSYVENFIYPTLRDRDPTSLARRDNYFGDDSIATIANLDDDQVNLFALAASDNIADDYCLTSHLDYCFVKMPLKKTGENTYTQEKVATQYPYTHGWAVCTFSNYKYTWTTLGVGELASWDGTSVTMEKPTAKMETFKSYPMVVADIATLGQTGRSGLILKAIYQPGPDLKDADYTPIEDKCFVSKMTSGGSTWAATTSLNTDPETGEPMYYVYQEGSGAFSFNYQWARKTYIDGQVYGVKRCRRPGALCTYFAYQLFETPTLQYETRKNFKTSFSTFDNTEEEDTSSIEIKIDDLNIYSAPVERFFMQERLHVIDTSKDVLKFETTIAPAPHQYFPQLYDYYTDDPEERSTLIASAVAGVRQKWLEEPGGEPLYWLPSLGYYHVTSPEGETFDAMIERLCLHAAAEQQGLRDRTMYLSVGASGNLRLPNPVDDSYWYRKFTNDDLDIYSQCIHDLTEQIATLHPDKADDTWWRTIEYAPEHQRKTDGRVNITEVELETARVPRMSYHQLILFWLDYKPWFLEDGKPEATKPVPLSAAEADAIPLDVCTLVAHSGFCNSLGGVHEEPEDDDPMPAPEPTPTETASPSPSAQPSDDHDERVEVPADLDERTVATGSLSVPASLDEWTDITDPDPLPTSR